MLALTAHDPVTRQDFLDAVYALQSVGLGIMILLAALLVLGVIRLVVSW